MIKEDEKERHAATSNGRSTTVLIKKSNAAEVKVPASLTKYPEFYPPFPEHGSLLGGRYFVLERLGQGTFCSIHKCIDLSYIPNITTDRPCFVAAKVELSSFSNSGVLEGEAMVLRHLHQSSPSGSFPVFCEYLRNVPTLINPAALSGEQQQQPTSASSEPPTTVVISAIIMEYLPGEDMARLRDRYLSNMKRFHQSSKFNSENTSVRSYSVGADNVTKDVEAIKRNRQLQNNVLSIKKNDEEPAIKEEQELGEGLPDSILSLALTSSSTQQYHSRRINVKDAVYLCADVLLPLLKTMHEAGVIHRDVKPSNCVRVATTSENKNFVLVDFGLSKSFVVPEDSSFADITQPWTKPWCGGDSATNGGNPRQRAACLRKERETAEFRGTSMYASLRVHQHKDYCRRDDLWSLWYVFCDFISGGLPWMISAKQREREACRELKEEIHKDDNARVGEMLYGPAYHSRVTAAGTGRDPPSQVEMDSLKLQLPNQEYKVKLLRDAFQHLCSLSFTDQPDYGLMEDCFRGFSDINFDDSNFQDVPTIEWDMPEQKASKNVTQYPFFEESYAGLSLAEFCQTQPNWVECSSELIRDLKMAKMDYNSRNISYYKDLSKDLANNDARTHILADWVSASCALIYSPWDVTKLERWGASRSNADDFRRENFVQAMQRCLEFVEPPTNFVHQLRHFLHSATEHGLHQRKRVKRATTSTMRLFLDLEQKVEQEQGKAFAPPPKISFSASFSTEYSH